MCTSSLLRRISVVGLVVTLLVASAHADFVLIEDFEDYVLGPIDDQGPWSALDDTSLVAADPADGENLILSVETKSTLLRRPLLLSDDSVRVLFMRFRFEDQLACSFGMSDSSYPDQFGHFEVELSLTNAMPVLRINDGGRYKFLETLTAETWYNAWLLINNITDDTQIWLHARPGEGADAADQLDIDGQTVFEFRDVTAGDLRTFYIKTAGGSGPDGPLMIDDIYLEDTDALNLTNPLAAAPLCAGDLDCDGWVTYADIDLFIEALNYPAGEGWPYECPWLQGDCNVDGSVSYADIDAFVSWIGTSCP